MDIFNNKKVMLKFNRFIFCIYWYIKTVLPVFVFILQ